MISYNRFDERNVTDELESIGGFGSNFEDLVFQFDEINITSSNKFTNGSIFVLYY